MWSSWVERDWAVAVCLIKAWASTVGSGDGVESATAVEDSAFRAVVPSEVRLARRVASRMEVEGEVGVVEADVSSSRSASVSRREVKSACSSARSLEEERSRSAWRVSALRSKLGIVRPEYL